MPQKLYLNILKYGSYVSLIVVFFVFKNLLFPFITSKQISFNILIEILLIFWIALIVKYPQYRPKKHYVWFGLLAFMGVMVVSCFTGVDFNLSFWGDVERMLGVFHILHFLAFYFIIITAMRSWNDWKWFLNLSVAIAVIVSLQVETGDSYGTIGNTAYVSGYLIFNMFFAWILFFREKTALKWVYPFAFLLLLPGFMTANTSGAWVGLGSGIVSLLFLYGVLHQNKKVKIATLLGTALALAFILNTFIFNRDNVLTRNSEFLGKMVQEINVNKRTFQTRLVSWEAALKDFPNHPFLGTGHGNYAITFDRHFSPKFYDYARGETYFDRAHNNVLDILTTTGALGLLAYMSVLGALAYYLARGYRRDWITVHDFVLISSLTVAYFVQNLAVFDSLVTYMGLMITLGLVYWLTEVAPDEDFAAPPDEELTNKEIFTLAGAGLILLTILYQYNIKPYKMLTATIDGQRSWAQGDITGMYENYQRALDYNTVLDRDSRTSMIRLLAGNPAPLNKVTRAKGQEILDFMLEHAKRNVAYNPGDSLNQMMYAQLLNSAAIYNRQDPEKFFYYSDQALEAINASIDATPGRTPVYFQKAQIQMNRNEIDQAVETLKYAAFLNENDVRGFCHLGRTLYYYERQDEAWEYLDRCIAKGGAGDLQPAGFLKGLIPHYREQGNEELLTNIYISLTNKFEKKNPDNWTELAKLYAAQGKLEKAEEAALQVKELDPSMAQYVDEFINSLR